MTFVLRVRNVYEALHQGLCHLFMDGIREESRNGAVLVAPGPVITEYERSWERVLLSPLRDANPFFHLMEAIWMMAGGNDVDWPMKFNSKFIGYSDDGRTLKGAYGYRWRTYFGMDQLPRIAEMLKKNPKDRRAVLNMWSAGADLGSDSRDVPCNTHVYFDCRGGKLNMTVCCRSNDVLWGAYGANAVHFSILQEVMAAWIDVPIGTMRQLSNNYHLYTAVLPEDDIVAMMEDVAANNAYRLDGLPSMAVVAYSAETWLVEARRFLLVREAGEYTEPFFSDVAVPMLRAWERHKAKDDVDALNWAREIQAPDWGRACVEWLERRQK